MVRGLEPGIPHPRADAGFGKAQLDLMLRGTYLQPKQLPAYEWNFGDVNPPLHAWSTIFTYRLETAMRGRDEQDGFFYDVLRPPAALRIFSRRQRRRARREPSDRMDRYRRAHHALLRNRAAGAARL